MDAFNSRENNPDRPDIVPKEVRTEPVKDDKKTEYSAIPASRLDKLNQLFESFAIVSEGADVFLCDMKYDYSRWSKSFIDFFNLDSEYMFEAGKIWEEHIHPEDREVYRKSIEDIFSGAANGHDMQYRAADGQGRYYMCTCRGIILRDPDGNPEYFGGAIRNQTIGGGIDPLTGLGNQMSFFKEVGLCLEKHIPINIVMYGPTHFSRINDLYGYDFGNMLLQHVSRYLFEAYRNVGNVYRLDGIRIAFVTKSLTMEQLAAQYEGYRKRLKEGISFNGEYIDMPINAGALSLNRFDIDKDTLFSCLTQAYYQSKNDYQGAFREFNNDPQSQKRYRIDLINKIRKDVHEGCNHFNLYYQPVVDSETGKLKGAEALIRWVDDDGTVVPPNDFIPVLENDALFPTLGEWILFTAMKEGKKILEKYPAFVLNVNLSYAQLQDDSFIYRVHKSLRNTGYPPKNLCLEITERCRLIDIRRLQNLNEQLQLEGIRFALDDFGTGFSSLGLLKDLSIDTLKVDRQFILDVDHDKQQLDLVSVISKLAKVYGCTTCVEGVETEGMESALRTCNVDSFQGYYYSKPLPYQSFLDKYGC